VNELQEIKARVERQRVAIERGEGVFFLMDDAIPYLLSQLEAVTAERDRLRKALKEIASGTCREFILEDGCPVCIAKVALAQKG